MINILPLQFRKNPISFKEYHGYTEVVVSGKKKVDTNNYTGFMRDAEALKFTKDYIFKNYPNGTNIAEFGCSLGQKPYSLMLMLDEKNIDKKYKITGYDFPEVINKSKNNIFEISKFSKIEQVLFPNYVSSNIYNYKPFTDEEAEKLRISFEKYFIPQNSSVNKLRCPTLFSANTELTKDVINFKPGDIREIDKLVAPQKTGVVIFQNALYHILSETLAYDMEDMIYVDSAKKVFEKINKVLPKDGIFVLGNMACDHIYDSDDEDSSILKYQDNKQIRVYENSKVHKALYESGFKPVFYEKIQSHTPYCNYREMYLPSVWKKVSEIR